MKHSRLVLTAVVLASIGAWAVIAVACSDKTKTTASAASTASASSGTCTAEMAKNCTPEMAAACQAARTATAKNATTKGVAAKTVAMDACCGAKSVKTSATSASSVAPVGKVNAMAVGYEGCPAHATAATAVAAGSSCSAKSATAVAAGSSCSAHGTSATAAGTSCPMHGAAMTTAAAAGTSCPMHGAGMMAAGSSCSAHGSTAKMTGHDCDACADMAMCEEELRASGANVQIVPLKNGVMYVYAAEGPAKVQAVQAAMSRRTDRVAAILAAGDKATLCPDCKTMRGAMASGKLTRETVNIEGGCLTLMTSNDPALVAKIHSMAGVKTMARSKS